MSRGGGAAALCLLALIGTSSCHKSSKKAPGEEAEKKSETSRRSGHAPSRPTEETLVLGKVLIETTDPEGILQGRESELRSTLKAELLRSAWLKASEEEVQDDRRPRRVEAMVDIVSKLDLPSGAQPGSIALAVQASLRFVSSGSGDMPPRTAILVEKPLQKGDPETIRALTDEVLSSALEASAASMATRVRMRQASDAELLSSLSAGFSDPGMVAWALELAAERGLKDAVPAAIAALGEEDEVLQAAATAALVDLRDERAVAALSKSVDFKDYEKLAIVMEAISSIGGEEALEFLEFVKSGHADADLRQRAEECIQRLKAKEALKPQKVPGSVN